MPSLWVIIPVLNEEYSIEPLMTAIVPVLNGLDLDWTLLFVDDGSTDRTLDQIRKLAAGDSRVRALSFSRNFGKEQAIAAGLKAADGDAVIVMDADLQHPPSAIPQFVDFWRNGVKVVFGQRMDWETDGIMRRMGSDVFHAVYGTLTGGRLPRGMVDFVLLDRSATEAMNRLHERARFTKGLFTWIGFNAATVPFNAPERAAGTSKFNLLKLFRFGLDGIAAFSTLPLRVWSYIGAAISLGAFLYAAYFFIKTLILHADVPGFPSIIVSIMFFSGIQILSLGVLGEYVGRIFEEVKHRPLYIVAEEIGFAQGAEMEQRKHG